jgi:outer membrane protein OmpA-like peptidoglycan-associated protein/tetratricopeptide (TPR) repeat protein
MKKLSVIFILLVLSFASLAQSYSTNSKAAIKRFEKARGCFENLDNACAEEALLKAIQADPGFVEALQMLAQVCYDQGKTGEAIGYYTRSLEAAPGENPDGYRLLANLTLRTGDYNRTLELIDTFLGFPPEQVRNRNEGMTLRRTCLFALRAMEHPVPFEPENLGDSVNSEYNEYWPALSVDEEMLMFTVMVPLSSAAEGTRRVQEDLYFAQRMGEDWGGRVNAGAPLNTLDNEGAHTMTADGRFLYFTACNRRDGQGQCDIYQSERVEGNWSEPVNIGRPVNSRYSEKHPAISADGRKLYFASDRPGGIGSFDIWVSTRSGDHWGEPVNLGDSVNSEGMEQSPFLHPDQQSLYFSSDGWPGMGQGDLFLSKLDKDRHWTSPKNLGYPINTFNDEIGLSVSARGNRAFFASDRGSGKDTDLYTFELPAEMRPVLVSYMKGRVYDARNMRGVRARMQLIDLQTEDVVMELESEPDHGDYLLSLPTDREYALNISAGGYLFYSEHFTFSGTHSSTDPLRKDIPMERMAEGSSIILENIFFDVDSDSLRPASTAELNKVVEFLKSNPQLEVEIGGHTDGTGSCEYNQNLSERRAKSVVKYLTGQGISQGRLSAKGYGDKKPVGDNTSQEGRAMNRRTELKIIQILRN